MTNMNHMDEALEIITSLGLPSAQHNERSALSLLALLDLTPEKIWADSINPLIGITPIMVWISKYYHKNYAPNSRETMRRQTIHQFINAGIALCNPDEPGRPVNSPWTVYQIESAALELFRTFGTSAWPDNLATYQSQHETLVARYAHDRVQNHVQVRIAPGMEIAISPGEHNQLIKAIIEDFMPRYAPDGVPIYVGDTGDKWVYFNNMMLSSLGVDVGSHGKMPDVVFYCQERDWLLLVESVTSHGPIDGTRHDELAQLFAGSKAGLVYVTAFPNRSTMSRYLGVIAWETEVWVAEAPSHLVHFNGDRFLGPYGAS